MFAMASHSESETRHHRNLRRRWSCLGTSFAQSRGQRFARRIGLLPEPNRLLTLADMINLPDWILCDRNIAHDIAAVTALLYFRRAIDHELSGARLRAICESVGEHNYDLACAAPMPSADLVADAETKMPSPDQLQSAGQNMLDRALPAAMRQDSDGNDGDAAMRTLSNIATALVLSRKSASEESPV